MSGAKPMPTFAIVCSRTCPVGVADCVELCASALEVVLAPCVCPATVAGALEPACVVPPVGDVGALPGLSAVCTPPPPRPVEFCRLTPAGT